MHYDTSMAGFPIVVEASIYQTQVLSLEKSAQSLSLFVQASCKLLWTGSTHLIGLFQKNPQYSLLSLQNSAKALFSILFLLGLTVENNAYANLCRANKEHYGICDKKAYS